MLQTRLVSPGNTRNVPLLRPRHQKHPVPSHCESESSDACRSTAVSVPVKQPAQETASETCRMRKDRAESHRITEW